MAGHAEPTLGRSRRAGQNAGVDVRVMLGVVNAEVRAGWRLERRLAGGWNEGAYLLSLPGGSRAVLKWRASDPERLLGARERGAPGGSHAPADDDAAAQPVGERTIGRPRARRAPDGQRESAPPP